MPTESDRSATSVLPKNCSRCGRHVLKPVACWSMKGGKTYAYCTHDCHEKGPRR